MTNINYTDIETSIRVIKDCRWHPDDITNLMDFEYNAEEVPINWHEEVGNPFNDIIEVKNKEISKIIQGTTPKFTVSNWSESNYNTPYGEPVYKEAIKTMYNHRLIKSGCDFKAGDMIFLHSDNIYRNYPEEKSEKVNYKFIGAEIKIKVETQEITDNKSQPDKFKAGDKVRVINNTIRETVYNRGNGIHSNPEYINLKDYKGVILQKNNYHEFDRKTKITAYDVTFHGRSFVIDEKDLEIIFDCIQANPKFMNLSDEWDLLPDQFKRSDY